MLFVIYFIQAILEVVIFAFLELFGLGCVHIPTFSTLLNVVFAPEGWLNCFAVRAILLRLCVIWTHDRAEMHTILALEEADGEFVEGLDFVFAEITAIDAHIDHVSRPDLFGAFCTNIILVSINMLPILTFLALIRLNATLALTPFTFRILNNLTIRVFFVLSRIPLLNVGAKRTVILVTFSSNFKLFFGLFHFLDLLSVKLVLQHLVDGRLFEARMAFAVLLT